MKDDLLKPGEQKVPFFGLACPVCHSINSGFVGGEKQWVCFDCLECFTWEQAYRQKVPPEPHLIGYTQEGGHWYLNGAGDPYMITKESMKISEKRRIQKWPGEGYDPIWSHNWKKRALEEKEQEEANKFFNSLTPEKLAELKGSLNNES
jgi:hypothetical protein